MREKIALYISSKIEGTKRTGGLLRFIELLNGFPKVADLTLVSGDSDDICPSGVRHIYTAETNGKNSEAKLFWNNIPAIHRLKGEKFDHVIVFDVPPALGLTIMRVPNVCIMVRKDLIGYEKIILADKKNAHLLSTIKLSAMKIAEYLCFHHADKIIVQCEYDKNEILKRHPLYSNKLSKKIAIQINNVNPSWIVEKAKERIVSEKNDIFTVGCIGNFSSSRKGSWLFLEAVALIDDSGIEIKAMIAGDGSLLNEYTEKYKKYENIVFLGRVSNPVTTISKCDLAVVPSLADSCPNTVMEAIYAGVPVVAAKVGGIPEILCNEDALFDISPESLKERIVFYMDSSKREKLKEQQSQRKKELTFDWSAKVYAEVSRK